MKSIIEYLKTPLRKLAWQADLVRQQAKGSLIFIRGLIEFSNYCHNLCQYCGIRQVNTKIKRYRLSPETIIEIGQNAIKEGYKTLVLQSGEGGYSDEILFKIIQELKKNKVVITLSLGEKSYEILKDYRQAGAERYLLRMETTNPELYRKLHPKMSFNKRLACLENLRKLGYEVGTGSLVGLPGQTLTDLARDLQFFQNISADMIGLGPFIPHPQTPLSQCKMGSLSLTLKMLALSRILLPQANIPATTALGKESIYHALNSGANVVMLNLNIPCYRSCYSIYPKRSYLTFQELLAKCPRRVFDLPG